MNKLLHTFEILYLKIKEENLNAADRNGTSRAACGVVGSWQLPTLLVG
jgi:hypothetical protein